MFEIGKYAPGYIYIYIYIYVHYIYIIYIWFRIWFKELICWLIFRFVFQNSQKLIAFPFVCDKGAILENLTDWNKDWRISETGNSCHEFRKRKTDASLRNSDSPDIEAQNLQIDLCFDQTIIVVSPF